MNRDIIRRVVCPKQGKEEVPLSDCWKCEFFEGYAGAGYNEISCSYYVGEKRSTTHG